MVTPTAGKVILVKIFALAAAVPIVLFSVMSAASELHRFSDPCRIWAYAGSRLAPSDACPTVIATSETRTGVVVRLALVQGTAILFALSGLMGAYRDRSRYILTGACGVLFLSIPLMTGRLGLIALLLAVCLFVSYCFSRSAKQVAAE